MFDMGPDMIFRIPALLIAMTVHEYAHARVAVALGDPTPRLEGRLTLNPVAHLDPIGLLMLWIAQFGWAKPVQVNPRNFDNGSRGMMYVSLAGPGANLITAFVAMAAVLVAMNFGMRQDWLITTLQLIYSYNIIFAVFNMLPIPPLDGSKVLMNFLPGRIAYEYAGMERYGMFILIALVFTNVTSVILGPIINFLSYSMMQVLSFIF